MKSNQERIPETATKTKENKVDHIALKGRKESSKKDSSTSDSEEEGKRHDGLWSVQQTSHRECPKQLKYQNQGRSWEVAWSDEANDDEKEKTKDEKCLMAKESNEITLEDKGKEDEDFEEWLAIYRVQEKLLGLRIIAVTKLQIVEWHNYKHLDWIMVRRDDDKLYTFKEGNFNRLRIQDIKDMLLLLVQGKLTNLAVEERLAFNVSVRMFTRSVVIQRRVEDLQLGVESYQKKLNLTKPNTYISDLKGREAYTAYSNPRGFIY
ncbi:hypothetical protein Tco_0209540 [Tanacetum coccineum]